MHSPGPDPNAGPPGQGMAGQVMAGQVILSNGFGRFPLAIAAAEAARHGRLACLVTGAYPIGMPGLCANAPLFNRSAKLRRLAARREAIPEDRIASLWFSEAIGQLGYLAGGKDRERGLAKTMIDLAHACYARSARSAVSATRQAALFHYRSGYGLESVAEAKRRGMVALCHHSIAHPQALARLVGGSRQQDRAGATPAVGAFWQRVLHDLEQADHVLTNSDFVRQTFLEQGWAPDRVHALYFGLDDAFLSFLPSPGTRRAAPSQGPIRLAFAGEFAHRKGATILIEALSLMTSRDWTLELIGRIDGTIAQAHPAFFADPRVRTLGTLSRQDLAARLADAELFVFPSLAEGSARVVFEALACGCPVVTTPNSGSIVEEGVHGALVPPGDAAALAQTLDATLRDRARLAKIGAANATLVGEHYTQARFGDRLDALYRRLLGEPDHDEPAAQDN